MTAAPRRVCAGISEIGMSQETILLAIYNENATQARQHELFRQAITAVVGGIAGAVVGASVKEGQALLRSPLLPWAEPF
jgi:hypothetical protein